MLEPGLTIRRATPPDAALLATHRATVWHEVGDWSLEDLTPQIPIWTAFFERCVSDETYVAFIAEHPSGVLGSGAVLVHRAIPRPGIDSEYAGRVQSVYVVPHARRNGIARAIMERLLTYARAAPLINVMLHPSEGAQPLYRDLGFEPAGEMVLRLG